MNAPPICVDNVQVPVDMVANTTIAAIAKHGMSSKPQLNVYHVATDYVNPLRFSDMFEYIYQHFREDPLPGLEDKDITKMKLFNEFGDFSKFLREEIAGRCGMNHKRLKARVAYAEQVCKMYEFIGFFKAR